MWRVELESALKTRSFQTKYVCILYSGSVETSQHALYMVILRMRKLYAALEVCPTQPRPWRVAGCKPQLHPGVSQTRNTNAYGDIQCQIATWNTIPVLIIQRKNPWRCKLQDQRIFQFARRVPSSSARSDDDCLIIWNSREYLRFFTAMPSALSI